MNFSCLFKPHYVCFFSFFKGQGAEIEQGTKMFRGKSSRTFDRIQHHEFPRSLFLFKLANAQERALAH